MVELMVGWLAATMVVKLVQLKVVMSVERTAVMLAAKKAVLWVELTVAL